MPFEETPTTEPSIIIPRLPQSPYESSHIIQFQKEHNGKKTGLVVVVVLILLAFLGITISYFQKKQPIAEIRNFAHDAEETPRAGFGSFNNSPTPPPVDIAVNKENPCVGTNCNTNTAKTIPARVTLIATPTPTVVRKVTAKPTVKTIPSGAQQSFSPTPTSILLLSCQRVEISRGAENMTQHVADIHHGDQIQFIGYVTDIGKPVATITFRLMINDQVAEEKAVSAVLTDGMWVGQYSYTFTTYGKHRVTVIGITPK